MVSLHNSKAYYSVSTVTEGATINIVPEDFTTFYFVGCRQFSPLQLLRYHTKIFFVIFFK